MLIWIGLLLSHCLTVAASNWPTHPAVQLAHTLYREVEGGFSVGLQTRHGVFRERGLLQKRSGMLDVEGAVRETG